MLGYFKSKKSNILLITVPFLIQTVLHSIFHCLNGKIKYFNSVLNHRFLTRSKRTQRFLKAGFLLNSMAEGCGHFLISQLLLAQNPAFLHSLQLFFANLTLTNNFPFTRSIHFLCSFLSRYLLNSFSYPDLKDEHRYLTLSEHVRDLISFERTQHPILP